MASPRSTVLVWLATLFAFLALDAVWISMVALDMFKTQLGNILRPQPMILAIVTFYLIYAVGLFVLAVRPALATGSARTAATSGAMLGLTAYSTYDLTNLALIERYTVGLAVADLVWGTVASLLASIAGYAVGRRLGVSSADR